MKNFILLLLITLTTNAFAARDFKQVNIEVTPAAGEVFMLQGAGGNIAVLATDNGLLLVDDQFAPLATKIEQAMKKLSNGPIKYIVNTHFHSDHTGGNHYFSHQAPIFAHQNVRTRLNNKREENNNTGNNDALPVVTYQQGINIHLADENIQLQHYANAHTDGDTVVYFKHANVVHTGDLFFEVGFPYIDVKNGGSVKGYLAAVNAIIASLPENAVIIPGHGKMTNKARYSEFSAMIDYSINHVSNLLAQGKSEQQILAIGIGEDYQQWSWQFISEERWLKTLIVDLK